MRCIVLGCISFFLFASAARADWLEASSDHFIIYSDQSEKTVSEFSQRLERFHAAMVRLYKQEQRTPSPSNRVTVFVVSSAAKVRKVVGMGDPYLAGIYIPRAGSCVAVIPRLGKGSKFELSGETTLYHEYAHHFMRVNLTSMVYPRWFDEGFAEFFAGVRFRTSGNVELGSPPYYRAGELLYAREIPVRSLLDFDGGVGSGKGYGSFYIQSWVLFHYLQMAPERAGQLTKYGQLLAAGQSALEAAENAFGDLQQLDRDMDAYLKRPKVGLFVIPPNSLSIGAVTVRKLRPGEAAIMPIVIESRVGVTDEEARSLVPKARKIAEEHPNDPSVLAALAEAEFDAGNDDAAIAAADRALVVDSNQINALIQKGYALSRKVENGALPKESWKEVRAQFLKANRVENDHPIPLVQFYRSYLEEGEQPTKNAIQGLEWAMVLAPFDPSLRWQVAQQMIADERWKDAAQTLAPLAYSPHPGEHTDTARQLLKEVEAQLEAPE